MNDTTMTREREVLEKLAEQYRDMGYRFYIEPQGADLPSFLNGMVPDAIALKNDDNVLIEVKSGSASTDRSRNVDFFSKEIPKHKGWRFQLVVTDKFAQGNDRDAEPDVKALKVEISKVKDLITAGDMRLALVVGWGLLEALTRRLVLSDQADNPKRYRPSSVVELLGSEDYISSHERKTLLTLIVSRNRIVHGFTNVLVDPIDLQVLSEILDNLMKEVDL